MKNGVVRVTFREMEIWNCSRFLATLMECKATFWNTLKNLTKEDVIKQAGLCYPITLIPLV